MATIRQAYKDVIKTLSEQEVIELHGLLTNHPDILKMTEPVSPSGVKNPNLLSSAVQRQLAGLDDIYIYDNTYSNCATLVFGIACNHAFHNGNKRAALLCLIKHLYKNGYVLKPTLSNDEIYEFLRSIAANEVDEFARKNKEYKSLYKSIYNKKVVDKIDADLKFIEKWIQKNSESKNQSDRQLRWTDLFKKLDKFKIDYEIDEFNSRVTITKNTYNDFLFFKTRGKPKKKTYACNGPYCSKNVVKDIRSTFELNKTEGLDSLTFYADSDETFIDYEIQLFKKAIYKLSKN